MFAGVGIALGNFGADGDQPLVLQMSHGGAGGFGEFDQLLERHLAPFLDDVPDLALALGQFRKLAVQRHYPDEETLAPASLLLADGFGQDALERNLRRAAIIFANPPRQLEDFGRDEGLRADDLDDGPQAGVRGFLGQRRHATQHFAGAEGHLHAAAHIHLVHQLGRDEVIELLAQGEFEGHTGNH